MGIAKDQDDSGGGGGIPYGTTTGTDTYAATITPTVTSYVAGASYMINFANANTGASTIDLDGVGPIAIVKNVSTPLVSGDILAGKELLITYDGTNFQLSVGPTGATGATGATGSTGATGASGVVPIATAAGTVDAITADYTPDLTLTNLVMCAFVASGANTSTTPTFAPDGLTAHTIVRKGGQPLVAGDIPGALAVCLLEYNSANTRWELLNPAGGQQAFIDWSGSDALVGYSAITTHIFRYSHDPNTKVCCCVVSFSGTSDATTLSATLPFTAAAAVHNVMCGGVTNNGTASLDPGRLSIASGGTSVDFNQNRNNSLYTASGTKTWFGVFFYFTV